MSNNLQNRDKVRFGYQDENAHRWQVIYKTEDGDDFCRETYLVSEHPTHDAIKRHVEQQIKARSAAPTTWANTAKVAGAMIERW